MGTGTAMPTLLGDAPSLHPESRVLILGTGGTICCKPAANGLMPIRDFLNMAMAPTLTFNDRTSTPSMFRLIDLSRARQGPSKQPGGAELVLAHTQG